MKILINKKKIDYSDNIDKLEKLELVESNRLNYNSMLMNLDILNTTGMESSLTHPYSLIFGTKK